MRQRQRRARHELGAASGSPRRAATQYSIRLSSLQTCGYLSRPAITVTRECGHVGNGRYSHPEQDHLLTVREMALIQGFPSDYLFEGPLPAKYNQIGDAVPPLIAALIAKHIQRVRSGAVESYAGESASDAPAELSSF